MCEFCESLIDRGKEIIWSVRSTMADDNINELVEEKDRIVEEMTMFGVSGYEKDGKTFVGIQFRQELLTEKREQVIVSPFSEMIQFNFCPICGTQLSDDIKDFDDYHNHVISIHDKEQ